MYPRQVALGRMPSLDAVVDLRLTDAGTDGNESTVGLGPVSRATSDGSVPAEATLELTAEDALLLLWERRDLTTVLARAAQLTGSRTALERVLAHPLVP